MSQAVTVVSRYYSHKRRANNPVTVWSAVISNFSLSALSKKQFFVVWKKGVKLVAQQLFQHYSNFLSAKVAVYIYFHMKTWKNTHLPVHYGCLFFFPLKISKTKTPITRMQSRMKRGITFSPNLCAKQNTIAQFYSTGRSPYPPQWVWNLETNILLMCKCPLWTVLGDKSFSWAPCHQ